MAIVKCREHGNLVGVLVTDAVRRANPGGLESGAVILVQVEMGGEVVSCYFDRETAAEWELVPERLYMDIGNKARSLLSPRCPKCLAFICNVACKVDGKPAGEGH